MKKTNPLYAFFDPAGGGWSASRFCFTLVNMVIIYCAIDMRIHGQDPTTLLWRTLAADAGVYLTNTGARVWQEWRGGMAGNDALPEMVRAKPAPPKGE